MNENSPALVTVPFLSRSRNRKPSVLPIQLVSSARPSPSRSYSASLFAAETVVTPLPSRSRMIGEVTLTVTLFLNSSFSIPAIASLPSLPSVVAALSTTRSTPLTVLIAYVVLTPAKAAVSIPVPPFSVSLPRPPVSLSSPAPPLSTLSLLVPVMVSLPEPPVAFSKPLITSLSPVVEPALVARLIVTAVVA